MELKASVWVGKGLLDCKKNCINDHWLCTVGHTKTNNMEGYRFYKIIEEYLFFCFIKVKSVYKLRLELEPKNLLNH